MQHIKFEGRHTVEQRQHRRLERVEVTRRVEQHASVRIRRRVVHCERQGAQHSSRPIPLCKLHKRFNAAQGTPLGYGRQRAVRSIDAQFERVGLVHAEAER